MRPEVEREHEHRLIPRQERRLERRQWTTTELEREVLRLGFEVIRGGRHAHHVVRIDPLTGRREFIGPLPGHKGKNVPVGTARDLINKLRLALA